jgi:ABC-type multidrug transport system ATPase subunit/DNA-binding SARP family transcriptional activator
MDVHLLGAVQAWADGRQLDLGPRKQRLAFAVLALHVNQLVTVNHLIDLTWTDAPPPTANHAIHVRVSALRTMLARNGCPEILTHGSAYVLKADPSCVDAHRFRDLVTQARAEVADAGKVELFRRGLDVWNGPPLADVASPEVVGRLCRGLEEARLAATEECLDAELRLGRHRVVIDELVGLTAQHPYRQRLLAQLMLALYRAGRAPEALGVYNDARRRLVGELGLDPEPRLRELQYSILLADPALDLPRAERNGLRTRPVPSASADDGEVTIEARGLSKRFGTRIAVADLSFTVRSGEVFGLLGPTGAGKTTAIRLLSTVLPPTSGEFTVAGIPSTRPAEIRRRVGVVPERAGYPGRQTGREYLRYHARLHGLTRQDATLLAEHLLGEVGLADRAADRIATYTRGMRRRLGIARALVNNPIVMLLDEPTLGLDPAGRHQVLTMVRDIVARRDATVVMATHDVSGMDEFCTRVFELGRSGTADIDSGHDQATAGEPWAPVGIRPRTAI